ncbi:phage holin [Candidatus Formimonas warabiya]|uniref:Phage holin n=1 Tax=Formimonas warabiya TaxID=1761012 RepID=A0A3G1KP05_FORW1|nr:phage holin [Candidatus Formimonas warabiya]ATW24192.1 phage holin [Candidatus Formimonas warabiya]
MSTMFYDVFQVLICLLAVLLAGGLVWFIKEKIGVEKMKKISSELYANKELAAAAVRYAQQVFWNQAGEIRYQKAAEWMSTQCKKVGLNIADSEIKTLIESALRAFKDEFGEEWGKAIAEPAGAEGTE